MISQHGVELSDIVGVQLPVTPGIPAAGNYDGLIANLENPTSGCGS
jgi:hypothetical protein